MNLLILSVIIIGAAFSVPVFLADRLARDRRNRELDKIIEMMKEIEHE